MRLPTVVVHGDVLSSWLTVSNYSRSRLAEELTVSRGRVSQLLTSREEPSAHLIAKLLLLTNLPFDRLFQVVRDMPPTTSARSIGRAAQNHGLKAPARRRSRGALVAP